MASPVDNSLKPLSLLGILWLAETSIVNEQSPRDSLTKDNQCTLSQTDTGSQGSKPSTSLHFTASSKLQIGDIHTLLGG